MEYLIVFLIAVLTYLIYGYRFAHIINHEKTSSTYGCSQSIKPKASHEDITWEQLGEHPMYDDHSDQGAVDIALKLLDLEQREAEELDAIKKSALATKMKVECKQLVELTLLSVAPPPPPFSSESMHDDNVVSFSDFTHTDK
jgi:hypothetical protein